MISSLIPTAAAAVIPMWRGRAASDPAHAFPALYTLVLSHPFSLGAEVTPVHQQQEAGPRTPPCVPSVSHLLGHRTVDILGDTAGHQIDRDGTNEVPAKSCVVLEPIAGAILGVEARCQCVDGAQTA